MLNFISTPGSRRLVYFACLAIAILMVSPLVLAGKPTAEDCTGKFKKDPSCQGGGSGSDAPSVLSDIRGNRAALSDEVPCDDQSSGTNGGEYVCAPVAVKLYFESQTTTVLKASNRTRELCNIFQWNEGALDVDAMGYAWLDSCIDDGACNVEVRLSLSGADLTDFALRKGFVVDRLELTGSGKILDYDPAGGSNPFMMDQGFPITDLQGDFYESGANHAVGSCVWALGQDGPVFTSVLPN